MSKGSVNIRCTMPQELIEAWLQHIRDFDVAHEGECHFEVLAEAPEMPLEAMVEALRRVGPPFDLIGVFRKAKPDAR